MNQEIYDKIYDEFEKYCSEINDATKHMVCDFDFHDDNQGNFCVYDLSYMEDEDEYKSDAINIFKENGVEVLSADWDCDCGNEYDNICCLNIVF